MAPRVLKFRKALGFTVQEAASLLALGTQDYEHKETGPADFTKDELIQLWNWFTENMPSLPPAMQEELKESF